MRNHPHCQSYLSKSLCRCHGGHRYNEHPYLWAKNCLGEFAANAPKAVVFIRAKPTLIHGGGL